MSDWQPIETAPKDGAELLVYNPYRGVYQSFWNGKDWPCHVWEQQTGNWYPVPTHWMPLPEPPK